MRGLSVLARSFATSTALLKVVASKGKSHSSNEWLTRQMNDIYVKKSRYDCYRCRSAYKLLEIDEKYNILRPGLSVVDCGAAPGSWTQVAVQKLKLNCEEKKKQDGGVVISVDLQHMMPIKGATLFSESDFMERSVQQKIMQLLPGGKTNAVLSDMAPKATGQPQIDNAEILRLVYSALGFAVLTLKRDGIFLCKVWDSKEVDALYQNLLGLFNVVKRIKPKACRADSAELFLLARGFKGVKLDKS